MPRLIAAVLALAALVGPGVAAAAIPCSDLPKAERFVQTRLRPGPNTRAAQRYINIARHARTARACSEALARADYYAKRSAAADRHRP